MDERTLNAKFMDVTEKERKEMGRIATSFYKRKKPKSEIEMWALCHSILTTFSLESAKMGLIYLKR